MVNQNLPEKCIFLKEKTQQDQQLSDLAGFLGAFFYYAGIGSSGFTSENGTTNVQPFWSSTTS